MVLFSVEAEKSHDRSEVCGVLQCIRSSWEYEIRKRRHEPRRPIFLIILFCWNFLMLFGLSWPKWSTELPVPALLYCHTLHLRKGSTIEDLPSLSQGYWKLDVILRLDLFPAFNQDNCLKSSSYTTIPSTPCIILLSWLWNYKRKRVAGNVTIYYQLKAV